MKKKQDPTKPIIDQLIGKPIHTYEKFHVKSSHNKPNNKLPEKNWPPEWKKIYYKSYTRFDEKLLTKPDLSQTISFVDVLSSRKSARAFSQEKIDEKSLSTLLYYSAGLKSPISSKHANRFYPSGGSRYPLEIYILSQNTFLKKGLYHYYVKNHSLEELLTVNAIKLDELFLEEAVDKISSAACFVLITAVFKRNTIKYGDRGYRYILQETGHLAQNIYLLSSALKLNCCAIGGYRDDYMNNLIDIDGINEGIGYVIALGKSTDEK